MDYRDRRGKFTLTQHFLTDSNWEKIREVMKDMIVLQTDYNYATAKVTFWACHPSFDKASAYAECPEYEIETSYSWKRK